MSATRPATEFSIGIMPNLASPEVIAAKQSSKVGQGTASASGYASRMARCEFAPGSPWNTILVVMAAVLPRSPILRWASSLSLRRSPRTAASKSKTILESLTCWCLAAQRHWSLALRDELARASEVLGGIDAERHAVDDLDVDAHASFERAELLKLLALFQCGWRQRHEPLQRGPAIGVEPDVVIKRALAGGRLGAGEIKCAQPMRTDR